MECLKGCRRLLLMTRTPGFYEGLELEEVDEGCRWKVIWPEDGICALEVKRDIGRLYGVADEEGGEKKGEE